VIDGELVMLGLHVCKRERVCLSEKERMKVDAKGMRRKCENGEIEREKERGDRGRERERETD